MPPTSTSPARPFPASIFLNVYEAIAVNTAVPVRSSGRTHVSRDGQQFALKLPLAGEATGATRK